MIDKLLIWKLNRASKDALRCIYDKYRDDLLRICAGLAGDVYLAEDVVQDVFVKLVESAGKLKVRQNLRSFLIRSVVNQLRDRKRVKFLQNPQNIDDFELTDRSAKSPDSNIIRSQKYQKLYDALAKLPYQQKEIVILRQQGGLKFREIAALQDISIKTAQSRYRYGLEKLRQLLENEVEK